MSHARPPRDRSPGRLPAPMNGRDRGASQPPTGRRDTSDIPISSARLDEMFSQPPEQHKFRPRYPQVAARDALNVPSRHLHRFDCHAAHRQWPLRRLDPGLRPVRMAIARRFIRTTSDKQAPPARRTVPGSLTSRFLRMPRLDVQRGDGGPDSPTMPFRGAGATPRAPWAGSAVPARLTYSSRRGRCLLGVPTRS
jgi:hypothetical protein